MGKPPSFFFFFHRQRAFEAVERTTPGKVFLYAYYIQGSFKMIHPISDISHKSRTHSFLANNERWPTVVRTGGFSSFFSTRKRNPSERFQRESVEMGKHGNAVTGNLVPTNWLRTGYSHSCDPIFIFRQDETALTSPRSQSGKSTNFAMVCGGTTAMTRNLALGTTFFHNPAESAVFFLFHVGPEKVALLQTPSTWFKIMVRRIYDEWNVTVARGGWTRCTFIKTIM